MGTITANRKVKKPARQEIKRKRLLAKRCIKMVYGYSDDKKKISKRKDLWKRNSLSEQSESGGSSWSMTVIFPQRAVINAKTTERMWEHPPSTTEAYDGVFEGNFAFNYEDSNHESMFDELSDKTHSTTMSDTHLIVTTSSTTTTTTRTTFNSHSGLSQTRGAEDEISLLSCEVEWGQSCFINDDNCVDGNGELFNLLEDSIRLEDLKRHRILGEGSFGQVWLVSHEAIDKKRSAYALKVLSKYELCAAGEEQMVINEKHIMSQLEHPFLGRLVNSYQDAKFVYLLMELLQGGELHRRIYSNYNPRRRGLAESEAKFYAYCLAEGLAYMHRRGYALRDLKPENVILDRHGYPVIVDFGFAAKIGGRAYDGCGTTDYMAPEMFLEGGELGHDCGADHWSLGVVTYQMLTGDLPFKGDSKDALYGSILKGDFDLLPPHISAEAAMFVKGLLIRDPADRLGSSLARGEDDVLNHAWFDDLDKAGILNRRVKAPYVPELHDELDGSHFDDIAYQDWTQVQFPELDTAQKKAFKAL